MTSLYTSSPSALPTSARPTTLRPSGLPTTASPTTAAPTTASPTTAKPTTLAPSVSPTTLPPTPSPTAHHRYSPFQQFEIDSSIVVGFVLVCVLAVMYRKRKKLNLFLLRLKYHLCCCRSARDSVAREATHASLNDFLFEVDGVNDIGRVNMSALTHDEEDADTQNRPPMSVVEVSISSLFPDLLAEDAEQRRRSPRSVPLLPQPSGGGAGARSGGSLF